MRVSDEVWEEIAKLGKFGESVDDVLRRVFGLTPSTSDEPPARSERRSSNGRKNKATNRMSANISNGVLIVEFKSGARREFKLPSKVDKTGIRAARDRACSFAEDNGATLGQVNAVKKALTEDGYYLAR